MKLHNIKNSLFIVAALFVSSHSFNAFAARSLGTATIASGGNCGGATSVRTSSCLLATVTNVPDRDGNVGSVSSLTANLKVSEPDSGGTPVGTVVMMAGGGSSGFYEALSNTTANVILPLLASNWRVIQLQWSTSCMTGDTGALSLAGRTATLLKAIHDDNTLYVSSTHFAVTGQSGGSAQIAYALAHYGAEDYIDTAIMTSGPTHARLDYGSSGVLNPAWSTLGQTLMTVPIASGGILHYNGADAAFVDSSYGSSTAVQSRSFSGGQNDYSYKDSIMNGSADYDYPNTDVTFLFGDNDSSAAVPMGRLYANTITAKSVNINFTTGSVQHVDVPGSTSGSAIILRALASKLSTWTPQSVSGMELWVHSHGLAHIFKEDASTQGLNQTTTTGDAVGSIDSPVNAHTISAISAATAPTLGGGNGSNSAISFSSSGSGRMLKVQNSVNAFRFLQATGIGTIIIHASAGADGVSYTYLDGNAGTTANAGVLVQRTTSNTIQVQLTKASSGNAIFNFTSTNTLLAADGVQPIVIQFNNVSGATIQIGTHSVESFSRLNATADVASSQDLYIGRRLAGTGALNGLIQDVMIYDNVVGSSDLALLKAWNPNRTLTSMVQATTAANGWYNFLEFWYDFTDVSTMYQDTSRATHVASQNDPIYLIDDKLDLTGHLGRAAQAASTGTRPLWISTNQGADWDGVDDDLSFTLTNRNAASTIIIVAMNRDTTNGSHFIASSGSRILVTGLNYSGNSTITGSSSIAYMTVHPGSGGTAGSVLKSSASGAWHELDSRRYGSAFTQNVTGGVSATATNTAALSFNHIGTPQLANWDVDGRIRMILKFNVQLTDAQISAIRRDLMATFTDL